MSRKFKLSNGQTADIDDSDLDEFMGDMEKAGLTVSLADSPKVDEPAPAGSDPQIFEADKAPPIAAQHDLPKVTSPTEDTRPGWLKALTRGLPGSVLDATADLPPVRAATGGLSHGLVAGLDQNLPGGDDLRARRQDAHDAAPPVYNAADAVGTAFSPLNAIGGAAGARAAAAVPTWLRGLVGGATVGGVTGAVQGGAREISDNPEWNAQSALAAVGRQGGVGAAFGAALGAGSDIARGVSKLGQAGADLARQKAFGIGKDELDAFALKNADRAAEAARASGLPAAKVRDAAREANSPVAARRAMVDQAERIVPPRVLEARGPSDINMQYGKAADAINDDIQGGIEAARKAGAQLPPDVNGDVIGGLSQDAAAARAAGYDAYKIPQLRRAATEVARSAPINTPEGVRSAKIGWDNTAFRGEALSPEVEAGRLANLATANKYRGQLYDYVDQAGDPALSRGFQQDNQDYGLAATIRDKSRALGLGAPANQSAPQRAADAAMSVATGGGYAPDLAAKLGRGVENTFGAVPGAESARGAGNALSALAAAGRARNQTDAYKQSLSNQDSRGDLVAANLVRTLRDNPGALGQFRDQLEAVADDPEKLQAAAEKLARDPNSGFGQIYRALSRAGGL